MIEVDPGGYATARDVLTDVNLAVADSVSAVSTALLVSDGMAGSDSGGAGWAAGYDPAAAEAIAAGCDAVEALGGLARLLDVTGATWHEADRASAADAGGRYGPDFAAEHPTRASPTSLWCAPPPSAAGGPDDPPHGWSIVAHLLAWTWPNGDPGRLRQAGDAWSVGSTDLGHDWPSLDSARRDVREQVTPESPVAVQRITALQDAVSDLADEYATLSRTCTDYADHLDEAHRAVHDELISLLKWEIVDEGLGLIVGVLTAGGGEVLSQVAASARIGLAVKRIAAFLERLEEALAEAGRLIKGAASRIRDAAERIAAIVKTVGERARAPVGRGRPGEPEPDPVRPPGPRAEPPDPYGYRFDPDDPRTQELAWDPSSKRPKLEEARVGMALEHRGAVPGPLTRDPTGNAEFTDATGNLWDVKAPQDIHERGRFTLTDMMNSIRSSVKEGEDVMLDVRRLNDANRKLLRDELERTGFMRNAVWYP